MKPRPLSAKCSYIISGLQIVLGAATLAVYFSIRLKPTEDPGYQPWGNIYADFFLAFAGLSIINLVLLVWEGMVAWRTKVIDSWLWGLCLAVMFMWAAILISLRVFPAAYQGV